MSQEAIESNAIVTRLAGVKTLPSSLHETPMMTWQQGFTDFRPSFCTRALKTPQILNPGLSYGYDDWIVEKCDKTTTAALRTVMRQKWSFSFGIS